MGGGHITVLWYKWRSFESFVHVHYWQEENVSGNHIGVVILPSPQHLWINSNELIIPSSIFYVTRHLEKVIPNCYILKFQR